MDYWYQEWKRTFILWIKISIVITSLSIKLLLHVPLKSKEQRFIQNNYFAWTFFFWKIYSILSWSRILWLKWQSTWLYPLNRSSLITALKAVLLYVQQTLQFISIRCYMWSKLILSERKQQSSMPEKATSTSDANSKPTRCIMGLFFSGATTTYTTMPQPWKSIMHVVTPWTRTDTKPFSLLHYFYKSTNAAGMGSLQAKLEIPSIYLPNNVSPITDQETHQLENILQADTARIEAIASQLKERKQTFDLDSLFHVHKIMQQEQRTHLFVLLLSLEYFVSHYTPTAINYDVIYFLILRTQNLPLKPPLLPLNALEIRVNRVRATSASKKSSSWLIQCIRRLRWSETWSQLPWQHPTAEQLKLQIPSNCAVTSLHPSQ